MGKKIDGFVMTIIPGVILWFYLSKRINNRMLVFMAAVLCCIVWRKLLRKAIKLIKKIPCMHRRHIRKNAGAAIMRISCLPQEKAHADIYALIRKCYPESEFSLEVIQQHPSLGLSETAVFQAWRKHIEEERLVICTTCRTDPGVRAFAAGFGNPKIKLIDSDMLSQMIAEYPDGLTVDHASKSKMRLRHAANLLINRKNAPRNMLFSASMLIMYLLSGNYLYLASALFLLGLAFLSLRRKLRPHKLF